MVKLMPDKGFLRKTGNALLTAAVFVILTIVASQINYNTSIEELGVVSVNEVASLFTNTEYPDENILFIDVSRSRKLVEYDDSSGNAAITDRHKLAQLFQLMSRHPGVRYKAVFCDLLLDLPSGDDTALNTAMAHIPKLILPFSDNRGEQVHPSFTEGRRAYAGYLTSSGFSSTINLLKFNLKPAEDKTTVPLALVESISGKQTEDKAGLLWIDGSPFLKTVIPQFRITPTNISDSAGTKVVFLDELLRLLEVKEDKFYPAFFENKLIVLGDFQSDIHSTYAGAIPGPFILTNLYLGVQHGDNRITASWLIFLFIMFFVLAMFMHFATRNTRDKLEAFRHRHIALYLLGSFVSYGVFIWLISLVSFIWFHKYVDVLLVGLVVSAWMIRRDIIEQKKHVAP
jgi:hypothetical protein